MQYLTDGEQEIWNEMQRDAAPDPSECWMPVEEVELAMAYVIARYADALTGGIATEVQMVAAILQPVSMAAVLNDLAEELGCLAPAVVLAAIGEAA